MSEYHHRMKMADGPCHQCEDGTLRGGPNHVSCDTCNFRF